MIVLQAKLNRILTDDFGAFRSPVPIRDRVSVSNTALWIITNDVGTFR